MNENLPEPVEPLPEAIVAPARRSWWIWLVPVLALLVTAGLVYRSVSETGPTITISFSNGDGLRSGQTTIKYRGVVVGEVRRIRLRPDQKTVAVTVTLDQSAEFLAREGSLFWVVRPEISGASIRGLSTLISGPFIQAAPGSGPPLKEFVGAESGPVSTEQGGLDLLLLSPQLGFIKAGSPVLYRGVEVGAVQKHDLATNARAVHIYVTIDAKYAPLVRSDTRFWNAGGVNVNWSVFGGLDVSAESFKSLISGGISFATPDTAMGEKQAKSGEIFRLYDHPEDAWLKWSPSITLAP